MLAPQVARRARDSAQYHVRLRVSSVEAPAGYEGGPCTLVASIERVFRGPALAQPSLRVPICCFVPPDDSPTGPEWLDFSRLVPGATLEAFLNVTAGGKFEVALYQIAFTASEQAEPDPTLWPVLASTAKASWPARLANWLSGRGRA